MQKDFLSRSQIAKAEGSRSAAVGQKYRRANTQFYFDSKRQRNRETCRLHSLTKANKLETLAEPTVKSRKHKCSPSIPLTQPVLSAQLFSQLDKAYTLRKTSLFVYHSDVNFIRKQPQTNPEKCFAECGTLMGSQVDTKLTTMEMTHSQDSGLSHRFCCLFGLFYVLVF